MESLQEAEAFLTPMEKIGEPSHISVPWKVLDDIAFQCSILLFYTKGEVEKLGELAYSALHAGCDKLNSFIVFAHEADRNRPREVKKATYIEASEMLDEIGSDLSAASDSLGKHGGSIAALAGELRSLAAKTRSLADSTMWGD